MTSCAVASQNSSCIAKPTLVSVTFKVLNSDFNGAGERLGTQTLYDTKTFLNCAVFGVTKQFYTLCAKRISNSFR
jgi:hypothetical protein